MLIALFMVIGSLIQTSWIAWQFLQILGVYCEILGVYWASYEIEWNWWIIIEIEFLLIWLQIFLQFWDSFVISLKLKGVIIKSSGTYSNRESGFWMDPISVEMMCAN